MAEEKKCCGSWGCKESDTMSDWTELKILQKNPNERFGQPNRYNRILFFRKKEWNPDRQNE